MLRCSWVLDAPLHANGWGKYDRKAIAIYDSPKWCLQSQIADPWFMEAKGGSTRKVAITGY